MSQTNRRKRSRKPTISSKTYAISLKPDFTRTLHHDASIWALLHEEIRWFFFARSCMLTCYRNTMERRLILQHSLFSGHNYITIIIKPTHDSYPICSKHGGRACESTRSWFSRLRRSEQKFLSSLTLDRVACKAPSETGSMSLRWLLLTLKIPFGMEDFP